MPYEFQPLSNCEIENACNVMRAPLGHVYGQHSDWCYMQIALARCYYNLDKYDYLLPDSKAMIKALFEGPDAEPHMVEYFKYFQQQMSALPESQRF